jgi:hypothetical protein
MIGDTGMDIGSIGANWPYITNNPVQKADRSSTPQTEDMFNWLDANGDSQLDTSELVEGAKKILREMGYAAGAAGPMSIARENEDSEQAPLDLLLGEDEDEQTGIDALL